ncbi:MAG: hypothetical protein Q8N23_36540 [Archangium sp.]|nr:hypothetical protein [Archangium sp.]MDP3572484.1 hypothetical protein [Archangium sp.]
MRWIGVVMVMGLGCVQPLANELQDNAALSAEPDPCWWDGAGAGLCFAERGTVFDGTACRTVCMQSLVIRSAVFQNEADCARACPCELSKLTLSGPGAGPFEAAGRCDELVAFTDSPGVPLWAGAPCSGDRCSLTVDGRSLDRRSLSAACRASALPQVREVTCITR